MFGTQVFMKILNLSLAPLTFFCLVFSSRTASAKEPSANLQLARQLNQAFVEVAENVSPSVVVITVTPKAAVTTMDEEENSPFENLPREFRRRFRRQLEEQPAEGQGSGIIIRPDGYILTNGHVVEEAETIDVRLQNGRTYKATVRGVDPQSDLAVIKIDAHDLPIAVLADSAKTRVGEFAIAIGAPFSLDYSVTFGHVSAKGRSDILPGFGRASMDQDFIQTDANINPGNSGGPLVNIDGEVMGINTLIRGLRTGIGFAIPSNLAREVSDQLIAEGKFKRAWLGIGIRAFRDDADLRGLIKGVEDGVVVSAILTNGPASKSDLKASDVITAVDGKPVSTPQQLRGEIRGKKIGQPVTLDVARPDSNGSAKMIKVRVKPAEWDEPPTVTATTKRSPDGERDTTGLGMSVRTLTPELAKKFGIEMIQGMVVVAVEDGTPAARKGIKPGDIITQMDHKYVANPKQFRDAVKKADVKKGIVINLISGDAARFEVLKDEAE
ncbi:MAG: serine protease Do [Verrucomicrobiota bacterium]